MISHRLPLHRPATACSVRYEPRLENAPHNRILWAYPSRLLSVQRPSNHSGCHLFLCIFVPCQLRPHIAHPLIASWLGDRLWRVACPCCAFPGDPSSFEVCLHVVVTTGPGCAVATGRVPFQKIVCPSLMNATRIPPQVMRVFPIASIHYRLLSSVTCEIRKL
ncbi:hypothetical protein EDB86DRAFT_320845 [Lactarius hatsudake]|nr:hypothetical protein EDB86DRAFT_320845 [Lactarius hatsudake]